MTDQASLAFDAVTLVLNLLADRYKKHLYRGMSPVIFRFALCLFLLLPVVGVGEITRNRDVTQVRGQFIVLYKNSRIPANTAVRFRNLGVRLLGRGERLGIETVTRTSESALANAKSATDNEDDKILQQLASDPDVEYVFRDRIVTGHHLRVRSVGEPPLPVFSVVAGASTFDSFYNSPEGWAVRIAGGYGSSIADGMLQAPWDITRGRDIRIAILDSGVDAAHPDIAPHLMLNVSEIDTIAMPSPCDDGSPQDQSGHGTWTASLAAGAVGPGTGQVVGVAPEASILNIKVLERMPANINGATETTKCSFGESSGLLSWVLQGIDDAISNRADVVSMSLGTTVDLSTADGAGIKAAFDRVTSAAARAGTVLVAAAGNDGYNLSGSRYIEIPAQAQGVIAVIASTNPDCREDTRTGAVCQPGLTSLAYYSNYGTSLSALVAPGGSYPAGADMAVSGWIRGACSSGLVNTQDGLPNDTFHSFGCFAIGHKAYVQAIGTSASAPLVAGAVALLRSAHPSWSAEDTIDALRSTAKPATTWLPAPQIDTIAALAFQPN